MQPDGPLYRNIRSHNTFATALHHLGHVKEVIAHLEPLIRDDHLFTTSAISHYLLAKALYAEGMKDKALQYGQAFIKMAQVSGNKESHIASVAVLLAVFDEDTPEVRAVTQGLLAQEGRKAVEAARKRAKKWRLEHLKHQTRLPPTSAFYRGGETPTERVGREKLRPYSLRSRRSPVKRINAAGLTT